MTAKILHHIYPRLSAKLQLKYKSRAERVRHYWEAGQILETDIWPMIPEENPKEPILDVIINQLKNENKSVFNQRRLIEIHRFFKAFPAFEDQMGSLSWTHWQQLLRIKDVEARHFYTQEAHLHHWTVIQLRRQIQTRFFERIQFIEEALAQKEIWFNNSLIKSPFVLEFLDLKDKRYFKEQELEAALLAKIQDFLLELGGGMAFVGQQQMLKTESGKTFFIDLVFYHYDLKCFVVIDLKVGELQHADIGQMDMYIRLFDAKFKRKGDRDTIGIIFCTDLDPAFLQYSMLHDHPSLFASVYVLQIPEINN